MKKRTCTGCRALTYRCNCEFDFEIEKEVLFDVPVNARPLEECPKPKTIKKYLHETKLFRAGLHL